MRKFEHDYRFTRRTPLSAEVFNKIWQDIDERLNELELKGKSWDDAIGEIKAFGLKRIDTILAPLIEYTRQVNEELIQIRDNIPDFDGLVNEVRTKVNEVISRVENRVQDELSKLFFYIFFFGE